MLDTQVEGGEWISTDAVLHVYTPHALTQVAGYLKHIHGRRSLAVYYRGQTRVYRSLMPSLYRSESPMYYGGKSKRDTQLNGYIKDVTEAKAFIRGTKDYAFEPLLQHYGARTRWLDLGPVDKPPTGPRAPHAAT
jgi:hypothetical protein